MLGVSGSKRQLYVASAVHTSSASSLRLGTDRNYPPGPPSDFTVPCSRERRDSGPTPSAVALCPPDEFESGAGQPLQTKEACPAKYSGSFVASL